jgi:hypothetical protein
MRDLPYDSSVNGAISLAKTCRIVEYLSRAQWHSVVSRQLLLIFLLAVIFAALGGVWAILNSPPS